MKDFSVWANRSKDGCRLSPRTADVTSALAEQIKTNFIGALALLAVELPAFSGVTSGYESWAGIPAHPAVVNPVLGQDAASVMSLRGKWLFTEAYSELSRHPDLCRMSRDTNGFWRADGKGGKLPPKEIDVPGCWEAQGIGEAGCTSTPWVCIWDCNRIALRHKHLGVGWYGKLVRLPETWNGKRIWIKLGGFGSQGLVWVNGRQVAWNDCYCGTYKYEITPFVKFGGAENYIAMQVVNCESSRKGEREHMNRWGGVTRDVELEATPRTFIDDAWVRGDFDLREAQVRVEIGGEGGRGNGSFSLRATVEGETREVDVHPSSSPSDFTLKVPLRNFRPWSPEHPNLYTARVELVASDGSVVHRRDERFGVRKIECRGKEFYLNGRPLYLRGYGDDSNYPETGVSPADREFHLRRLKVAKAAGFNAVRLHTHCENPEYFEAADEVGILVQPELPYYCSIPCGGGSFDPERDVTELYRHYRRYPSFAIYSMGNEGSFGSDFDRQLHRLVKAMDPDRLKINQDTNLPKFCPPDASDTSAAPIMPWTRNVTLADRDRPCVAHEYLNLCVKQDSRRADRYTGVWMPPVSREDRAKWLAKFGLTHHWGDRLQDAQHLLQRHYQKAGVELARSDSHCDGYHFWTLVDVTVSVPQDMTSSAQGLFDAATFGPKVRGFTAEEFARFNSAEGIYAILADTNVIHVAGEKVSVDFWFSHYGERAYPETAFAWEVVAAADGRRFAGGSTVCRDVALGPSRFVGTASFDAPDVARPTKALLKAKMGAAENDWEIWFFPKRRAKKPVVGLAAATDALFAKLSMRFEGVLPPSRASEARVVVADADSPEAKAAEERGQRVLAIGPADGGPNVSLGWWFMGSQVGTALADHPALSGLPHEGYLSPLLFRILKQGRRLVPGLFDEKDLLVVGEGGSDCYVYMAKKGASLVTYGLDLFAPYPEAVSLLDGLVADGLAAEMRAGYPAIRKAGAVSPYGEVSPFVFKGRLMRMELIDPSRGLDAAGKEICAGIRDVETGKILSTFGQDCYYFSAFCENDKVLVTGTERQNGGYAGDTIWAFESTDLRNWSRRKLLTRPGWRYFNTSLTKGPDGYVLLMESNDRRHATRPFTMFFATSKDLRTWTHMDDDVCFPKHRYAGGPFIRYHNGFYYVSLVTELPNARYVTYLYRTADFRHWECGRYNPLVSCSQDDRRLSPRAVDITPALAEQIKTHFIGSASDFEMCDFGGQTYINYIIGDQQGFYYMCEAWYDGPMGELLENCFK